jgi:hypothetical protein
MILKSKKLLLHIIIIILLISFIYIDYLICKRNTEKILSLSMENAVIRKELDLEKLNTNTEINIDNLENKLQEKILEEETLRKELDEMNKKIDTLRRGGK